MMEIGNLTAFIDSLASLDRKRAADVVLAWFGSGDSWKGGGDVELARLARVVADGRPESAAPLLKAFEQRWLVLNAEKPIRWNVCWLIVAAWNSAGNKEKAREWVMKAYETEVGSEEARERADVGALNIVSELMQVYELTGEGKGYPAMAAAIATKVRKGELTASLPWDYYMHLAALLGTPETRQTVEAKLIDPAGQPRLGVAKILTYVRFAAGGIEAWQAYLDGQVETAAGSPDAQAGWLLARAHADSVVPSVLFPSPLRGKKWLDQALALAASAPVRFQVLDEIVRGHMFVGKYEKATETLDGLGHQFEDEVFAKGVQQLRRDTSRLWIEADLRAERAKAVAADLHAETLKQRLDAARARGDEEAVRRYEALTTE
ncbi:MAG: hypothetical protein NTX40_00195 [Planctomycetota bacterium]|nr:hypothetical protein [Planctomycetota bacterium]